MIQSLLIVQTLMRPENVEGGWGLTPSGYSDGFNLYWFGFAAIITTDNRHRLFDVAG